MYYRVYEAQAKGLGKGFDEDSRNGHIDFLKHRRVQHATLDPRLDTLAAISTVKVVN